MGSATASALFEVGMLVGFGVSWPVSVWKSYSSKCVEGKSVVFLWCVLLGYVSGILAKVTGTPGWIISLYAFNGAMVAIDIVLHYRYRRCAVGSDGATGEGAAAA
jgi:hypothetical protein